MVCVLLVCVVSEETTGFSVEVSRGTMERFKELERNGASFGVATDSERTFVHVSWRRRNVFDVCKHR